jgi:TonB family protein
MLTEIVNHLWQSTLTAVAIAVLVPMLRDNRAHVRYWLWWAASVKFLVPFSLLAMLGGALAGPTAPLDVFADWSAALGRLAEPMPATTGWTPLAFVSLGVWACGFAAVLGTWLARAWRLRTLLRASIPFTGALPVRDGAIDVRSSASLAEPALVGIARPVLLLPSGIDEHLTRAQLCAVLTHELCHRQRRDNLTAAVHMLVEGVFWFHPLVWWVGARLLEERERACDEAVLSSGHDGRVYAEGILNVCERYVASSLKCVAGVSGADLKRRVVEIARNRTLQDLPTIKKIVLGAFALVAFVVPVALGIVSGRALAQDDRDVIPLVRIAPDYPPDALAARLEGFVQLKFTITPNGATRDVVVVKSSSPEFEASAIVALLRWRYMPRIENGVAVERRGVQTIIRYQLESDLL